MYPLASRSTLPCQVLPTPAGPGQSLGPVLHMDLSSTPTPAQLTSPGPPVLCPGREREREEVKRGRREGEWEGGVAGHGVCGGEGEEGKGMWV